MYTLFREELSCMTREAAKQIEYSLATLAIEKLIPSHDAIVLCERMSEGKITADEAVAEILKRRGLRSKKYNV